MKKSILRGIVTTMAVASCCTLLVAAPVSTMSAQAAAGNQNVAETNHAIKEWVYKEEKGKLYKRLWNCSTGHYEGSWIYICDL
ncbi:MAG: hypothetical protein NC092_00540 [Butyrivibrio sp.]|nr:hypothetical protein [Muribaculum sp.]MCM1551160.1 hypothetical protein [Butyrivibrio sp.]